MGKEDVSETGTLETYIKKAEEIVGSLDWDRTTLKESSDASDLIWEMSKRCRLLENLSIQNELYLVAHLASRVNSLLAKIGEATPEEKGKYLAFLKDTIGSLKQALNHVIKKRDYLLEIERFERYNDLVKATYLKEKKSG